MVLFVLKALRCDAGDSSHKHQTFKKKTKQKTTPKNKPRLLSWSCFRLDVDTVNHFTHGMKQHEGPQPRVAASSPSPTSRLHRSSPHPLPPPKALGTLGCRAGPSLLSRPLHHRFLMKLSRQQDFHQLSGFSEAPRYSFELLKNPHKTKKNLQPKKQTKKPPKQTNKKPKRNPTPFPWDFR